MHILYLDDSGSAKNKADRHIILAGITVPERQPHWLSQRLDALAKDVWPDSPRGLEFRGSDMLSGRKHWRGHEFDRRDEALCKALRVLATSDHVRIFAAAIHRAAVSPEDPMEYAFEQVCSRFDRMLQRMHLAGNTQRGLLVLDKSTYETSIQGLALDFKDEGHRWGRLHNIAEVPLFVDSRATRMVQYADLVASAFRQYYEHGISKYLDIISSKIDSEGGVPHGIYHARPKDMACNCLACRSR